MGNPRMRFVQFLILAALAGFTIYYARYPLSAPFRSGLVTSLPGVFSGFVFIVAMVERATEVVIGIIRTKNEEFIEDLKQLASSHGNSTNVAYVRKNNEFIRYRAGTGQLSLIIGYTIGIILSASGIGILDSVLNLNGIVRGSIQQQLIRGSDIVLTSGLLAGGSQAFHEMVANSIQEAVNVLREPNRT
jgi:hypothetical protein